jgi:sporulation protein YlmC with PRC-barrel domain
MLKHTLAASLLACAALTPVAFAQDAKPQQQKSAQADSINYIRDIKDEQFRSSNLVGKAVYNRQDESIGDISDLILDRNGRVAGVLIGVGGFLGLGQSEVAVPMNALRFERDEDAVAGTDANNAATGRAATDVNVEKQPGSAGSASGTSTSAALPNQNTKDQGNAQENAAANAGQAKQTPNSADASSSANRDMAANAQRSGENAAGNSTGADASTSARADEDNLANMKIVLNTSREDLQDAPKFGEAEK